MSKKKYRDLHALGIGTTTRQVDIITINEEEKLWENGMLSSDLPAYIFYAVYSTICMYYDRSICCTFYHLHVGGVYAVQSNT